MKHFKYLASCIVLACFILCPSCQNYQNEPIQKNVNIETVKGVAKFKESLSNLTENSTSRSTNEDPSESEIKELVNISRTFLEENNITNEDLDIDVNDEIIAIVALCLMDYHKCIESQTRTTVGGCVLEALGVREVVESLGKGAAKKIAKIAVKQAFKKAIPYAGWGLFAWELVDCILE